MKDVLHVNVANFNRAELFTELSDEEEAAWGWIGMHLHAPLGNLFSDPGAGPKTLLAGGGWIL